MHEWRRRRAAKRVKPGTGRELTPFRWWQPFSRSLYSLVLGRDDGHQAVSKLPAVFPIPGGTIEVAESPFGLKRCHYVTAGGEEYPLVPDHTSTEGRRARQRRTRTPP